MSVAAAAGFGPWAARNGAPMPRRLLMWTSGMRAAAGDRIGRLRHRGGRRVGALGARRVDGRARG
ncbi:hypothetical protein GLA29479_4101 [Lysobacter antibioticus]|nr:hypothetical protein GLA29479_4101 [Lysobacter antibioticus]